MRKPIHLALAAVVIVVLGSAIWRSSHRPGREPLYKGKRLSVWLEHYRRMWIWMPDNLKPEEARQTEEAVRHIGTNAIPTLLPMLRKRDFVVVSKLLEWRQPPYLIHIPYVSAATRNSDAASGFKILGTNALPALPELIAIYERNISSWSQDAAADAIVAIGPEARRAIPAFVQAAAHSNAHTRVGAISALGSIHAESAIVVPVVAKSLAETNIIVKIVASRALERFGIDARAAVPILVQLLKDTDWHVRLNAANALKKIDPEAAAKAGVK
jgi:hypothetical protein